MAKYSFETKLEIVQAYLSGTCGYETLAKLYGISSHSLIEEWVAYYLLYGEEGLHRSRQKKTYSYEFKLSVVESYLTEEISYKDLALKTGVSNPSIITAWVRRYREGGPDALQPKKKGRPSKMPQEKKSSPNKKQLSESSSSDQAEKLKKLEEENLHLRIENAYLKELRRLRQEERQKTKSLRESFTVSEKNSD